MIVQTGFPVTLSQLSKVEVKILITEIEELEDDEVDTETWP